MENKWSEGQGSELSPDDAKAALDSASDLASTVRWSPRRWAAAVVGLAFAGTVSACVWEVLWLGAVCFAVLAVLVFLLRRHVFNPYVRERPWQRLDMRGGGGRWFPTFFALWIPMSILIPAEPRVIGAAVGVLAGVHAYWGLRVLGGSDE